MPPWAIIARRIAPRFRYLFMRTSDIVIRQIEEIKENYIIPTHIESGLRNVLTIRQEVEELYTDSEKEGAAYGIIKKTLDSHIAGILTKCFARNID